MFWKDSFVVRSLYVLNNCLVYIGLVQTQSKVTFFPVDLTKSQKKFYTLIFLTLLEDESHWVTFCTAFPLFSHSFF